MDAWPIDPLCHHRLIVCHASCRALNPVGFGWNVILIDGQRRHTFLDCQTGFSPTGGNEGDALGAAPHWLPLHLSPGQRIQGEPLGSDRRRLFRRTADFPHRRKTRRIHAGTIGDREADSLCVTLVRVLALVWIALRGADRNRPIPCDGVAGSQILDAKASCRPSRGVRVATVAHNVGANHRNCGSGHTRHGRTSNSAAGPALTHVCALLP